MDGGLLDREIGFLDALRSAGVNVTLAEVLDATRAMGAIDLLDREGLRAALAATVLKRPAHRTTFDALFDLWFPPAIGDPTRAYDDEPAPELVASLLEALLAGQDRGGLAERVARQTLSDRIRQFQEMIESEVRRRLAEDRGVEQISKTAVQPLAEQVDFLRASRADMAELRRQVFPLARRLATRLTARRRLGRAGRLDFRRTVRASLATGGVPLVTHHRPHKPHKPELVVLCDVSGSVAGFAHFTLMLAYALREQFSKVRAFAFIDTCDEVTRFFTPGGDVADALARMSSEANLVWFDGHSDYGHSIEKFAEDYPDAVGPRTSLLILGDGRNNYRATGAQTLRSLVQKSRHAYWLNPEPSAYWGSGDSATTAYADVIEMVEVRNAVQLEDFVQRLLPS
jgi:uncharacterized protein with von Willebrand factor type A (vWA) domain